MESKTRFAGFGVVMMILTPIIGFIFAALMLIKISDDAKAIVKKFDKAVGTTVVLNKDTLTVIDYTIIRNSLKLSNNTEIAYELYEKIKLKP